MKKKYKVLFICISIVLCVSIFVGISYALWQTSYVQTGINVATTSCFNITFSDAGSKIGLDNAYPVTDEEGKTYSKYSFTITNNCVNNALVNVNQEILSDNTLSNDLIKSVLDYNTPVLLTNSVDKTISEATASYKVGTFFLEGNSSQTHSVGLWVDESANLDNSVNKVISTQISVVASATTALGLANNYVISLAGTTQGDGEVVLENGYRYEGKDPNNYVLFNDEIWRMIGVFDSETHGIENINLVKLIRNDSIGRITWDNRETYGISDWTTSKIKIELNDNFLINDVNEKSQGMIELIFWKLGGLDSGNYNSNDFYQYERSNNVYDGNQIFWYGKIGLLYPSDYGYSVLSSNCNRTTNLYNYNDEMCINNSWILNFNLEWTITSANISDHHTFRISLLGDVDYNRSYNIYYFRPSLYLKANTTITSGDGTIDNPYKLGII